MPLYRLLRNNKESGPYSLNDLVVLGLKPYDLVWVDGRSAAWRYPSEITELKEYAPAIEEQPYDRFFKKPSDDNPIKEPVPSFQSDNSYQQRTIPENSAKEEPVKKVFEQPIEEPKEIREPISETPKPSYSSAEPKKKVFVSMPETNAFEPYRDPYKPAYNEGQYEQYLPKSQSQPEQKPQTQKPLPAEEKYHSPINIRESDESRLETKYTQSLDDIKEMYINTLVQRKTKNKRKEILKRYIKPTLVPLLLVVFGVAIGYFINNRKTTLQASQSISKVVPQQAIPETKKEETPTDENLQSEKNNTLPSEQQNQVTPTEKTESKRSLNEQDQTLIQPKQQSKNVETLPKAVINNKKQKETQTETFTPNDGSVLIPKKSVEVDPNTGERKKVVRDSNDEATTKETNSKSNQEYSTKENSSEPTFLENDHKDLRDLVSVKSNTYVRGAFGGIRGLELTVFNTSDFLLDEVSVEVQIMKPSEQPLRTDIITFKNIGANRSVTVKVPDSQRGIRVDYRITNIESRQWQKSTAGL